MAELLEITDENYADVVSANSLVLIDAWATWCGVCKGVVATVERLADKRADVCFAKLNVEVHQQITATLGIRGVPVLVFVKDGEVIDSLVGAPSEGDIEAWMNKHI